MDIGKSDCGLGYGWDRIGGDSGSDIYVLFEDHNISDPYTGTIHPYGGVQGKIGGLNSITNTSPGISLTA